MIDITLAIKAQGLSTPLNSEEQQAIAEPLSYCNKQADNSSAHWERCSM